MRRPSTAAAISSASGHVILRRRDGRAECGHVEVGVDLAADRLGDLPVPEHPGERHAVVVGEGTAEPRVRRVLGSRPHVVARGLGLDADGVLVGLPALPRATGVEADSGGDHVHGARARQHQMRERSGEVPAPVPDDGERGSVASVAGPAV